MKCGGFTGRRAIDGRPGKSTETLAVQPAETQPAGKEEQDLPTGADQRERMLGHALSCASDFIYIFDRSGRFVFANQSLLDLWDIPLEAALGKDFFDLGYPHDLAVRLERQVQEVFETHRRVVDETPYTSASGVEGHYEYIFSPVIETDGAIHYVVGSTREVTDRKLTAALLEESRRRLALATESAHIGIWDWDVMADVMVWDAQMYELYGIRAEDFIGAVSAWQNSLHPEDRDRARAEIAAALRGEKDFHSEFRVIWPGGEVRDIEAHGVVLRAGDGSARRMIGVNWDITRRKRSENDIRQALQRLNEAQRIGRIGDWEWDIASGAMTWSPQVFEILGRDRGLGPPRDLAAAAAMYDEPSQALMNEKVALAVESGEAQEYELGASRPSGDLLRVRAMAVPMKDENGRTLGIHGTIQDITDEKAVEERLLWQAELLDLARDAIMVLSLDGQIQFWNRGAESIYGWTSAEAVGKVALDLLRTDPKENEIASKRLIEAGEWNGEMRQARREGTSLTVDSRWTLLRDRHGAPHSMLVINTDITEHKKLESQFLRAQRLESIGTLASGVAHDLNNILAPILLSVPLLREELSMEARESILSDLEASAQRGTDIVKQVLTFARGVEGHRLLVQPIHLIKDMAHIAGGTFPKSIQIKTDYSPDLWSVEADPTQLHQVLMNLFLNARDAMPNGGELAISVENIVIDEPFAAVTPEARTGPYILIQVRDTGTGIPQEIIDKIFDPFFTTKVVGTGTGLGLSTSIGIVKSHGGFISVISEMGGGATFKVYLPAFTQSRAPVTKDAAHLIPRGKGELLLLVDDEQSIRNMAAVTLELHGYKVLAAADGLEALAIFGPRMAEISAVITDITMPFMDGITLIRTLRKMKPEIAIIASTGQNDEKRTRELQALNVPVCLVKPYNRQGLLTMVGSALAGVV